MKTRKAVISAIVLAAGFGIATVQAAAPDMKAASPDVQKDLKKLDKDGDGFLSLEEFKAMKGVDDLAFKAADVNGDRRLSADEYAQYLSASHEYKGTSQPAGESPAAAPANPAPKPYSY